MGCARRHADRWVFVLAIATAALQIGVASRWRGHTAYQTALGVGWAGALWIAWLDRGLREDPHRTRWPRSVCIRGLLGATVLGATWFISIAGRADYDRLDRLLPLTAGVALAALGSDLKCVWRYWRELALLALPVLHPLPAAIREAVEPTTLTAGVVAASLNALGVPARRVGTILWMPEASLRVYDACSGIALMTQMSLLAVLVVCSIQVSFRRAAMVFTSAAAIGFLLNAARVTALGLVAFRAPSQFWYWEQYVMGSALFPVLASALFVLLWWRVMRAPSKHPALRPNP